MKIKFSIIISNTSRSISYLKHLKKNNLKPINIIYLNDKLKNKYSKDLKKKNYFPDVKIKTFNCKILNSKIVKYLDYCTPKNIIYSGYPGVIIKKKKILQKKNFIHSHSGKLPNYKGSTTIYYSLLKEKKIYCTTFILDKKLDDGKILLIKKYNIPKVIKSIDNKYDDEIRAKNLIFVLKNFDKIKLININKKKNLPYYVMHPLLKTIVFFKFRK